MKMTDKQLQKALCDLTEAHNKAFKIRQLISEHCIEVYGKDPSDVDFNGFIDGCDGGAGMSNGMTVDEFKKGMKELTKNGGE